MRTIKLTAIILISLAAYYFIKQKREFNLIQGLPFADGEKINIYHWASLIMILIAIWGYCRLNRKEEDDDD